MQIHRSSRVRDFTLYFLISALVIGAVIAVSEAGVEWHSFFPWMCFAVFGVALFGYFIADSRSFWTRKAFWVLISLFVTAHVLGFLAILAHVERVKPTWFVVELLEFVLFVFCRNALLTKSRRDN